MMNMNLVLATGLLNEIDFENSLEIIAKLTELNSQIKGQIIVIRIGDENYLTKKMHYIEMDKLIEVNVQGKVLPNEFARILQTKIKDEKSIPSLLVFPSNRYYKAISALISNEDNVGLTADCVNIEINNQFGFEFSRAAMNASIVAKIVSINSAFSSCTVKLGVFKDVLSTSSITKGNPKELIHEAFLLPHRNTEDTSSYDFTITDNSDLRNSKVVFCVGRGASDSDTVKRIKKIAKKFNIQVVGTKATVDMNIVPEECKVGQSGKNIAPDLYIGFGVSGASQHIVGIQKSKRIIAINNDPEAPIFDFCDYKIIDDVNSIVKILYDQIFVRENNYQS